LAIGKDAQIQRQQAAELDRQAKALSHKIADAGLAEPEQISRLRVLATELRVAKSQSAVRMVATFTPESAATISVTVDGKKSVKPGKAGQAIDVEFEGELHAMLPDFGALVVRGER